MIDRLFCGHFVCFANTETRLERWGREFTRIVSLDLPCLTSR